MRVISGEAIGIPSQSPKGYGIRPTTDKVKGTIFNRLMNIYPGDVILDLYAGTGGMGIEFLSRGAEMVKLGLNSFLTVKIAYANMLGDMAILVVLRQRHQKHCRLCL